MLYPALIPLSGICQQRMFEGERKFCGDSSKTCGKISQISANYRYVDGTPTPAKIQISNSLKVGQFYIDVYSIKGFESHLIPQIRWSYQRFINEFDLLGFLRIFPLGIERSKTFPRFAKVAQAGICIDRFKT